MRSGIYVENLTKHPHEFPVLNILNGDYERFLDKSITAFFVEKGLIVGYNNILW